MKITWVLLKSRLEGIFLVLSMELDFNSVWQAMSTKKYRFCQWECMVNWKFYKLESNFIRKDVFNKEDLTSNRPLLIKIY